MDVSAVGASGENVRSPLKDKPLRLPGQSVEEQRRKLIEDRFETPAIAAVLLFAMSGMEWWRSLSELPYYPRLYTGLALLALSFTAWRFFRLRPHLKALRLAAEGEKAVGQFLEELRAQGWSARKNDGAFPAAERLGQRQPRLGRERPKSRATASTTPARSLRLN